MNNEHSAAPEARTGRHEGQPSQVDLCARNNPPTTRLSAAAHWTMPEWSGVVGSSHELVHGTRGHLAF